MATRMPGSANCKSAHVPAMTTHPELTITGEGSHRISVRLEPVPHVPSPAFDAIQFAGADFKGEHDRGLMNLCRTVASENRTDPSGCGLGACPTVVRKEESGPYSDAFSTTSRTSGWGVQNADKPPPSGSE